MGNSIKALAVCNADEGIMCAAELVASNSELDHVDALGYSGMAFRIQTLDREILCPSTVSPRYGFKPEKIIKQPDDSIPALRQALKLTKTGKFDEYTSGQAAYDLWIELLEADEKTDLYSIIDTINGLRVTMRGI